MGTAGWLSRLGFQLSILAQVWIAGSEFRPRTRLQAGRGAASNNQKTKNYHFKDDILLSDAASVYESFPRNFNTKWRFRVVLNVYHFILTYKPRLLL